MTESEICRNNLRLKDLKHLGILRLSDKLSIIIRNCAVMIPIPLFFAQAVTVVQPSGTAELIVIDRMLHVRPWRKIIRS